MEKVVGKVNEKEKNNIIDICERKMALDNLVIITKEKDKKLFLKVIQKLKEVKKQYDEWWDCAAKTYKFEGDEDGHWEVNFQTGEVILIV